jgi:prepilin-type N-terminal cleavage/methylation domain-containing protein
MLQIINYKAKANKGFTLIEIMLVVALMVAIGGISVPVYQTFQVKNNVDVAAYTIARTLQRAQVLSQAGTNDSTWGVHIASGSATLFSGADFASRDVTLDELSDISTNIVPTGISDIVYSKLLGEPQTTGNVILTTSNNDTRTIAINAKGMIEY